MKTKNFLSKKDGKKKGKGCVQREPDPPVHKPLTGEL